MLIPSLQLFRVSTMPWPWPYRAVTVCLPCCDRAVSPERARVPWAWLQRTHYIWDTDTLREHGTVMARHSHGVVTVTTRSKHEKVANRNLHCIEIIIYCNSDVIDITLDSISRLRTKKETRNKSYKRRIANSAVWF